MRWGTALIAALSAVCFVGAIWLYRVLGDFYHGPDYRPGEYAGYSAGGVEADGGGIFAPAHLLLAVAIFLAKWVYNLLRDK